MQQAPAVQEWMTEQCLPKREEAKRLIEEARQSVRKAGIFGLQEDSLVCFRTPLFPVAGTWVVHVRPLESKGNEVTLETIAVATSAEVVPTVSGTIVSLNVFATENVLPFRIVLEKVPVDVLERLYQAFEHVLEYVETGIKEVFTSDDAVLITNFVLNFCAAALRTEAGASLVRRHPLASEAVPTLLS